MKQAWENSLRGHLKENMLPSVDHVLETLKVLCSKVKWT